MPNSALSSARNANVPKCASESPDKQMAVDKALAKENNNYKFSNSDLYDYKSPENSIQRVEEGLSNDMKQDDEFDGLLHKDPANSIQTMKILNALRKNRQLCDLILQLDDDSQEIYCHQIILACNSKFFMEIFTNYELEQASTGEPGEAENDENIKLVESKIDTSKLSTEESKLTNLRKKSLQLIVNKNHNSTQRQLIFCLSDYLRHFLKDNHHHHFAKINSIINNNYNHNSPYHHHYSHKSMQNVDVVSTTHDEKTHQMNLNLDYEALKVCVDYMYTSKLKVPSYLLPHVYTLAYHLSFENIVNVCGKYLTKHLSVDNCLSIRSFALDENLIQASTQCIEKNIEYILQVSTSFRSSTQSLYASNTTLNLAHKEFNHLPRINIELVGIKSVKAKLPDNIVVLTQMCMNWLVDELVDKSEHTLTDLCDNLSMLYMNTNDHMLHDCCDMDSSDTNFNDHVNDYQKQHTVLASTMNGQTVSHQSTSDKQLDQTNGRLKTFKITDHELNAIGTATPIKFKVLHDNEIICTHQVSENNFITICTLTGKLVALSVHILLQNIDDNKSDLIESDLKRNDSLTDCAKFSSEIELNNNDSSLEYQSGSHIAFNRTLSSHSSLDSERLAKMRVSRCGHGVVAHENKLYIIGGFERGECLSQCEVYDPKTNTIEEMPAMESRRGRAAVTWLQNQIYVMGGSDGHDDLNSIEYFNVEKQKWKSKRFEYELGFTNLGAIGCDSFIYLVGLKGDVNKSRTCCLRYEPGMNTFKRLAELNNGRSQSGLVCTSSSKQEYFLYVFGGYDSMRCLNSCEVYNVQEDKWTLVSSMHEARRGCGAAIHKETQVIYIVGGTNGSQSLKSVEVYDIKGKRWTTGPELNIARNNVAVEFIGDILFAIGGFDGKSFLKTIEYLNVKNLNNGWSMYHKQNDFEFLAD